MNYRSVVIYGRPRAVTDPAEKLTAFGPSSSTWRRAVGPMPATSPSEMTATTVLALAIVEASAKVRTGPPIDEPADLELDVWAGVGAEIRMEAGRPVPDALRAPDVATPGLRPPNTAGQKSRTEPMPSSGPRHRFETSATRSSTSSPSLGSVDRRPVFRPVPPEIAAA